MNATSASPPPPPPGLGDHEGLRQGHASHLHHPNSFVQPEVASFLPSGLASATALLQQYRAELQQHQATPSIGPVPATLPPTAGMLPPYARDVVNTPESVSTNSAVFGEEREVNVLVDIASRALVNNRIDLSLLSVKQRLAFADLVRQRQCQLQHMSQQAGLLLHQLERSRDGYLDSSRLLLLFPDARAALTKQGIARTSSNSHVDVCCPSVQWIRTLDASVMAYPCRPSVECFDSMSCDAGPPQTTKENTPWCPVAATGSSHVSATGGRGSQTKESMGAVECEREQDNVGMMVHSAQPFTRNSTRSRTTPAVRGAHENWVEKASGDNESFSSIQGIRCFSVSSSLAEAAAATSAETPAALDDSVRDGNGGDVSALLGEFAMLQAQPRKSALQQVVDVPGDPEDGITGSHATAEGTPVFQRNKRRTTTMPNGCLVGKQTLLSGSQDKELLGSTGAGSLAEFTPEPKGDLRVVLTPTPVGKNGRCVRIDTNSLSGASAVRQDYGNIITSNDVTALLGDLKLLQEASASVQAAGRNTQAEANSLFQRNNRRTTTLPGTMANVKIRATDVQRVLHTKGRCKPCAFYYNKRKGCRNGSECEFCHHEEHSKLTLKQWKKHQQRAHRTRLLEDCEGADVSGLLSDFQSAGVLLEPTDSTMLPTFASGHGNAAPDVQHSRLSRPFTLSSPGFTVESLAHVRERLAELSSATEASLPDGS